MAIERRRVRWTLFWVGELEIRDFALVHVLEYLSSPADLARCAQVSHRWRRAVYQSNFWRREQRTLGEYGDVRAAMEGSVVAPRGGPPCNAVFREVFAHYWLRLRSNPCVLLPELCDHARRLGATGDGPTPFSVPYEIAAALHEALAKQYMHCNDTAGCPGFERTVLRIPRRYQLGDIYSVHSAAEACALCAVLWDCNCGILGGEMATELFARPVCKEEYWFRAVPLSSEEADAALAMIGLYVEPWDLSEVVVVIELSDAFLLCNIFNIADRVSCSRMFKPTFSLMGGKERGAKKGHCRSVFS